jgi:hypothetical protein
VKYRDLPVGLDPQRHLGADQAEAGGIDLAREQARAVNADLGLGRAGNHRAAGIAYDDVAQAQRNASGFVALEHRAADIDLVLAADAFLDGRREPVGRDIELDRPRRDQPPEQAGADAAECDQGRDDEGEPAHQRGAREPEHAQRVAILRGAAGRARDQRTPLPLQAAKGLQQNRPTPTDH